MIATRPRFVLRRRSESSRVRTDRGDRIKIGLGRQFIIIFTDNEVYFTARRPRRRKRKKYLPHFRSDSRRSCRRITQIRTSFTRYRANIKQPENWIRFDSDPVRMLLLIPEFNDTLLPHSERSDKAPSCTPRPARPLGGYGKKIFN